jgi:hypothetical protein
MKAVNLFRLSSRLILIGSTIFGSSSLLVTKSADASTSWNAYLRTCKPILVNQEGSDYNAVYRAIGGGANLVAAISALSRNTAQSLSSCSHSPDASLNRAITSYTYYAYVAETKLRGAAAGRGTVSAVSSAINQMNNRDKTVLNILARDFGVYG